MMNVYDTWSRFVSCYYHWRFTFTYIKVDDVEIATPFGMTKIYKSYSVVIAQKRVGGSIVVAVSAPLMVEAMEETMKQVKRYDYESR